MLLSDLREDRKTKLLNRQRRENQQVPRPRWRWDALIVNANTKSEARAKLKKLLGTPLPIGINIVRVAPKD